MQFSLISSTDRLFIVISLVVALQSRPVNQHSNGEDGQQQQTTKGVVGAKVSQLAHLFQNRTKEESVTAVVVPPPLSPVSPTAPVAPPAIVVGRTKSSSRSETDKETHQEVYYYF